MDEKKLAAGFPGVAGGPLSGVGVSGAGVIFESLLGPIAPDPALLLRCVIMFPGDEALELARERAGEDLELSGCEGSVGVGGVLTMTGGVVLSPASGGVWGGLKGSSLVGREIPRGLPVEVGVDVLANEVVAARLRSRLGTDSFDLSAASVLGLLSSLELCSEPFLDRKTSRNRPVDDFVVTARRGAARLVSLAAIDGTEESRLSTLPPGRVVDVADLVVCDNSDIWEEEGCGSGLWAACTRGDDVVR